MLFFLNYSPLHKGYKCLHVSSSRVYISRDTIFNEKCFPCTIVVVSTPLKNSIDTGFLTYPFILPQVNTNGPPHEASTLASSTQVSSSNSNSPHHTSTLEDPLPIPQSTMHFPTNPDRPKAHVPQRPETHLPHHPMTTKFKNQISKPKPFTDGTVKYLLSHALIAAVRSEISEPSCYTFSIKDVNWHTTMNLEFDALLKNQTWRLVPTNSA